MRAPTPANRNDGASWWQRILAAERAALLPNAAADERNLWIAAGAVNVGGVAGTLDLAIEGRMRLAGALRCASRALPLRDDSVDSVILQHALEVVDDHESLLDEALRVLKPERNIVLVVVGALSVYRLKAQWRDSGAPRLLIPHASDLQQALARRGCVEFKMSRITIDRQGRANLAPGTRFWSGLQVIEARKRTELPNVRRLGARQVVTGARNGWVARPSARKGIAA